MKYNILYTGVFLDKKSKKTLKNWFKLKKQKNLLKNICADVAVLSVIKKPVSKNYLSKIKLGDNVELEVCGYLNQDDMQMVICTAKSSGKKIVNNFLKIVVSTNNSHVSLSSFSEDNFIECNGPSLKGQIGCLNDKKEILLKLPEAHEDS